MATKGLDMQSRRILEALLQQPGARLSVVADELGMAEDVVEARLAAMQESGIVRGFRHVVDAARLGMPHEVLIQGVPSAETTREALEGLAARPGVTRVFALAARRSIAFTVRGQDPESVNQLGLRIAHEIGLVEATAILIVDTIHDDPSAGVGRALKSAIST